MMIHQLPPEIIQREIDAICERYRIAPQNARKMFDGYIQRRPDLLKKIAAISPKQDITRLKAYKTLIKEVRKHIYYHLRQYQPQKERVVKLRARLSELIAASGNPHEIDIVIQQLLQTHISTQERLPHYQEFYRTLFGLIQPPRTILDIGCGIHPLTYPYRQKYHCSIADQELNNQSNLYVAIDKQPDVIETLHVFAPAVKPTRLIPVCADIADVAWETYLNDDDSMFGLALMLKLIPVIFRQQRHLLTTLANVPARYVLITAATESMTRKANIQRREDRVLQHFINLSERTSMAKFQVGNEFGYLLRAR
jgi:16S rRNA (guanine(1405)-N(7))-methyltransferase